MVPLPKVAGHHFPRQADPTPRTPKPEALGEAVGDAIEQPAAAREPRAEHCSPVEKTGPSEARGEIA